MQLKSVVRQGVDNLNKLFIHPSFKDTLNEINELNIKLPNNPTNEDMDFQLYTFPPNGELVSNIEEIKSYKLNPKKGQELTNSGISVSAYDESINKFSALEGTAFLTSHSLVLQHKKGYIPSAFLSFYFYTRSKVYTDKSKFIKYSKDPETDSKIDYVKDRTQFIINNTPKNSVVLIDGPLIGGQVSTYTFKLNQELLKKNVIPIFFVKNTSSNLVTDYINELRNKYNSDMHWAHNTLKVGERTNFFKYVDKHNPRNAKLFCYLKPFNVSPQRIEFHLNTFEKFKDKILDLMDIIYYLLLAQGDPKNPQIRTIAIAEKFARDSLKLVNINKLMREAGIMPTINQERFGW